MTLSGISGVKSECRSVAPDASPAQPKLTKAHEAFTTFLLYNNFVNQSKSNMFKGKITLNMFQVLTVYKLKLLFVNHGPLVLFSPKQLATLAPSLH